MTLADAFEEAAAFQSPSFRPSLGGSAETSGLGRCRAGSAALAEALAVRILGLDLGKRGAVFVPAGAAAIRKLRADIDDTVGVGRRAVVADDPDAAL